MAIEVKIGGWWAMCCIHDLDEIKTQNDLDNANDFLNDPEEEYGARYWPTLSEALEALEKDIRPGEDDFERGIAYALRRAHNLPITLKSMIKGCDPAL